MSDRHELRTVADFYRIPSEKREACLQNFRMWLDVMEGLTDLFQGIDGVRSQREMFAWIDDGKHDAEVSVDIIPNPKDAI